MSKIVKTKMDSSEDAPETPPKHTLLTIPTEVMERIARSTASADLLRLRLSNKLVADRTADAFTARFLETRAIVIHGRDMRRKLRPLHEPKLASSVKHLRLGFDVRYWELKHESKNLKNCFTVFNSFMNLRSLELHALRDINFRYKMSLSDLRLPHLEVLVFYYCQFFKILTPVPELLANHKQTLTSLRLHDPDIRNTRLVKTNDWIALLEAAKVLRNAATVEISTYCALVSFLPYEGSVTASDDAVISAWLSDEYGIGTKYYRTEAGNLHGSLACMIRDFREFESLEQMDEAGVLGQFKKV